ncbi:Holliday junction resolvase RuvX [Candidatus Parcubacteria bacterium]|nr:MAG: Holliday junction resolvase RuvX [Candidatus Parcubacteria bacterium]
MPILGIDYGDKKVGLAISDSKNKFALPLEIIANRGDNNLAGEISKICSRYEISRVVVGIPLTLRGKEKDYQSEQTKKILGFAKKLSERLPMPVVCEDERFTSKMASQRREKIKTKGEDHDVAAMLILQSYLDRNSQVQNSNAE